MPIYPRSNGYQVDVRCSRALRGYRRIRVQRHTEALAKATLAEIETALATYGKWPVEADDAPLAKPATRRRSGTLRQAAGLAIENHWKDTVYGPTVAWFLWPAVAFFEERGKADIDAVDSYDVEAYVQSCRDAGNTASTINKKLSALSVVNKLAIKRRPPLATSTIPLERVKAEVIETWWLTPEAQVDVRTWLHTSSGVDNADLMADYIDLNVYTGLRVGEMMALRPRHFVNLGGDAPTIIVPGTKTKGSQASIACLPAAEEVAVRAIARAKANGHDRLFPLAPRQMRDRWEMIRAFLGVQDVKTATLRALRRSFAKYATTAGMPGFTLQRHLRHASISTTEGYLRVAGAKDLEDVHRYFPRERPAVAAEDGFTRAISAYKATGASPEEVARFARAMTAE